MRPEKKYLVEEVAGHLAKSDYVYLANYDRITVEETAVLRTSLAQHNAEFHVVKNSIVNVAAKERSMPDIESFLSGPTAIIVGGENPSGVAKVLKEFFKDKEKVDVKAGVLSDKLLSPEQVEALAALPGLEVLQAQLLGLLSEPARRMVTVLNAVPQSVVNVLQAKVRQESGE